MLPASLTPASFSAYPPQGRSLARAQLALLQDLPLALVPILLRELITYDWRFPAERRDLHRQLTFLSGLTSARRAALLQGFRDVTLSPQLASTDWVNDPSGFMEKLTASLWSNHQMDRFRDTADKYAAAVDESEPIPSPSMPRLGIVVIGAGAEKSVHPLFQKLRPKGVHLTRVKPENGLAILLAECSRRAAWHTGTPTEATPLGYGHWYIDGGAPLESRGLTEISYAQLQRPRALILDRIQKAIGSGGMGPEDLRTLIARLKPTEIGLGAEGSDPVLDHFQLTLLTEGAGTQIFATTFTQWAARECLRRAQPETLIVRYAPRQEAQTLNVMLSGAQPTTLDLAGSLVDADMGAFYTWINMRRLPGSEALRFIVWFEEQREAVVIGPDLPLGTSSDSPLDMEHVVSLVRA